MLYGYQPYEQFEQAIHSLYDKAEKVNIDCSGDNLFKYYSTLTTKEYALLTGIEFQAALQYLTERLHQGRVKNQHVKNGDLWIGCG